MANDLAFHHLYVFVGPGAPVVDDLVARGFLEGSPNTHEGQGTANRRIFFENGMLEFIWIENEAEVRSPLTAPTRLWERSRHAVSGFSPFGVALCPSSAPVPHPFEGWAYRPEYLPSGLEIWQAKNDAYPWEPSIFYLSFVKPYTRETAKEPVAHPSGARRIKRISLTLTKPSQSDAALRITTIDGIELKVGPRARAEISFEGSVPPIVLEP